MMVLQTEGTALAYLAGVLHGDGFYTPRAIGLHVKDLDFAETFCLAIREISTALVRPSPDRGRYWRVVIARPECFRDVKDYAPQSAAECSAWLRGYFDSEGSAYCRKTKRWENSFNRRISFFSTDKETLETARKYCEAIGVTGNIRQNKRSMGHFGKKEVFELRISHSRDNFGRFVWLVGSSIDRKMDILRKIPLSFSLDMKQSMRAAQKIGAASKRKKTLEVTLPCVLMEIRAMIAAGVAPTQRNCSKIKRYGSVVAIFGTAKLADMAASL